MRNNQFRYLHLFLVVASLGLVIPFLGTKDEIHEQGRRPTSVPKVYRQRHHHSPTNFTSPKKQALSRSPASYHPYSASELEKLVVVQNDIPLSHGNVVASNIGAVSLDQWRPEMGQLVWDDGVYGYFIKSPGQKTVPVAYNPMLRGLYPISSVLHVRKVSESDRHELKAAGHEEYYYFPRIQKLSLKSTPDQVLKDYQALQKRGYQVKLEVIQHRPRTN